MLLVLKAMVFLFAAIPLSVALSFPLFWAAKRFIPPRIEDRAFQNDFITLRLDR